MPTNGSSNHGTTDPDAWMKNHLRQVYSQTDTIVNALGEAKISCRQAIEWLMSLAMVDEAYGIESSLPDGRKWKVRLNTPALKQYIEAHRDFPMNLSDPLRRAFQAALTGRVDIEELHAHMERTQEEVVKEG